MTQRDLRHTQYSDFKALIRALKNRLPLRKSSQCGRVEHGVVATTDFEKAHHVVTMLIVSTEVQHLVDVLTDVGPPNPLDAANLASEPAPSIV